MTGTRRPLDTRKPKPTYGFYSPEARVAARKPAEGSPKQAVRDVTEVRPPRLTQHPQAHPKRGLRGEMVAPGPRARAGGAVTAWAAPRQAPGLDLARAQRPSRPGAPSCSHTLTSAEHVRVPGTQGPHRPHQRGQQGHGQHRRPHASQPASSGAVLPPGRPTGTAGAASSPGDHVRPAGATPAPVTRCAGPVTAPSSPSLRPHPTSELSAQVPTPAPGPLDGVWE